MRSPDTSKKNVQQRLRRGAYILPSLFTMGNIMLGFYAVVLGIQGHFRTAAWLIFIAGVLDGLDGRIARLTGTESDFGKEFDSLADVLTFGAGPALLAFLWALQPLGRIGWLVPLFFLLCTAVRLARFNVQTKSVDSRFFVGLPSPVAAAAISSIIFVAMDTTASDAGLNPIWLSRAMPFALLLVGSLMVSTFRYPSMKKVDLKQRLSYRSAILLASTILLLVVYPEAFFPLAAFLYTVSGPFGWLWGRLRRRRNEPTESEPEAIKIHE